MNKDDILNKRDLIFYGRVPAEDEVEGSKEKVFEAMDEYAKQQSIAFINWASKKAVQYDSDSWLCGSEPIQYSTEELYNLFIKQQNKQ